MYFYIIFREGILYCKRKLMPLLRREDIMKKNYVQDMTTGDEFRLLVGFSVPMLVGNLFQQVYNLVDSVIVGQYIGADALAAVGATGSINFLLFSLCFGLSNGIGIVISQYFGAND